MKFDVRMLSDASAPTLRVTCNALAAVTPQHLDSGIAPIGAREPTTDLEQRPGRVAATAFAC